VQRTSSEFIQADPEQIVTLSFRVANRSSREETLRERVELPEGWHLVVPLFDFILGAGGEMSRIVVIRTGRPQAAGDYDVRYHVTSRRDSSVSVSESLKVIVPSRCELYLLPEGPLPERVAAGEPFSFQARLVNGGNVPITVTLSAAITGGGTVTVEPASFGLAAGDSRVVGVGGHADPALKQPRRRSVLIDAACDRLQDGRPLTARVTVPIEVVPLVAGEDIYHRFPLELSVLAGLDDHRQGMQFSLAGEGHLDENRRHRLEFSLRAPDRTGRAVLGDRDEYWMRYGTTRWTAKAGDLAYGLSDLTSHYRYGRGAGVELHVPAGSLTAGMYHAADRWGFQERRDTGGYLSHVPGPGAELRFNVLRLHYDAWSSFPATGDTLFSLQGQFRFRDRHRIEMEYGFSRGDRHNMEMSRGGREGDAKDRALRLSYNGVLFRDVGIILSSRRSGPDFSGRNSDSAVRAASLSVPLNRRMRFNSSCNRYERNLQGDPRRGSAPRENLYRSGVSMKLPLRWFVGFYYERYDRSDDLPADARRLREHNARVTAGRSAGPLWYRLEARRGRGEDLLRRVDYRSAAYEASAAFRHRRGLFISLICGFGTDDQDRGERYLLRRERYFGGSVRWKPTENGTMYGTYRRNDLDCPGRPMRERADTDHYNAGFRYRLPNGHRLELDVRRSDGSARESRTICQATYTIPLDIPLGRRQSSGSLSGKITRADVPGRAVRAGAVVYVDDTASRTDDQGRFQFLTLSPGVYELRLDERVLEEGLVVADGTSTTVTVAGGTSVERDIRLTASASLFGRIVIVEPERDPERAEGDSFLVGDGNGAGSNGGGLGGIEGILVEICRHGDLRRTISDQHGTFLFEGLHPGEWTVKVYGHNLPEHHYTERSTLSVSMAPGETGEIVVEVRPRLRRIKNVGKYRLPDEIGME
jgi:hypothetical protein